MLIDDSCQYWLDLQKQTLSSPYHPRSFFADGHGCEWLITAPEGHIISLEFDHFSVSNKLNSKIFLANIHHDLHLLVSKQYYCIFHILVKGFLQKLCYTV